MTKRIATVSCLLIMAILNLSCTPVGAMESTKDQLIAHQTAVHITDDWIRDPYIISASDGHYYLTGTTQRPKTPANVDAKHNTGLGKTSLVDWKVKLWKSTDLITWQYLGTPFTLKDGYWYQHRKESFDQARPATWRLWAPEIHYLNGQAVIIHTSPSPVKGGANFAFAVDKNIQGPWRHPFGEKILNHHDPSLFQDDDGTWWMIWGATTIAPLNHDFTDYASPPVVIAPQPAQGIEKMGHEGCLVRKIAKKYVLFGTGWSTNQGRKGSYNLYYATADRITGPYSQRRFAGRFLGHGTPFLDKQERWWCTAFYNANIPPLPREGIRQRDLSETAQTINAQGTTLVPLEIKVLDDGDVYVRAKDPDYAAPGPDEQQKFKNINGFWR